jgi:hypothetical protein
VSALQEPVATQDDFVTRGLAARPPRHRQ